MRSTGWAQSVFRSFASEWAMGREEYPLMERFAKTGKLLAGIATEIKDSQSWCETDTGFLMHQAFLAYCEEYGIRD